MRYRRGDIPVTCVIYTLNEGINLPKCLKSLEWCDDVVVVDSFSSDETEAICREAGVRFVQHPFTGFGDQRNWSFDNIPFKHNWVFVLDADEEFTPALVEELADRLKSPPPDVAAFRVKRRFYLWGKWLRYSSLYPTWVVRLIHKGKVRYANRGHAETQVVNGRIEPLNCDLKDENLKGLKAWFERQNDYSTKESLHELSAAPFHWRMLSSKNPLERREGLKSLARLMPLRPLLFFAYSYFARRGFLDGRAGFYFCVMKAFYTFMIEVKKFEVKSLPPKALPPSRDKRAVG